MAIEVVLFHLLSIVVMTITSILRHMQLALVAQFPVLLTILAYFNQLIEVDTTRMIFRKFIKPILDLITCMHAYNLVSLGRVFGSHTMNLVSVVCLSVTHSLYCG